MKCVFDVHALLYVRSGCSLSRLCQSMPTWDNLARFALWKMYASTVTVHPVEIRPVWSRDELVRRLFGIRRFGLN